MLLSILLALTLWQSQGVPEAGALQPLELNADTKLFLDEKVDRGLPAMLRLEALVEAVFRDRALGFTYAPATRTPVETFTARSGNCLSFTLLFIAMCRYLDLDARFREVEIAPLWTRNGNFISLNKHINAAVLIGNVGYAIDVFPGVERIEVGGQVVSDERGMAHFYNNKGVEELGSGNIEAAEENLRTALEMDATAVSPWINLGAARAYQGDYASAERYYRRALELNPRDHAAMSNLAIVMEKTHRPREATRLQAKVREFQDKNPYYHLNLGIQAYGEGRYQLAIDRYRKALKLKPREHNFHFALARAYAGLNRLDQAVKNLQLAFRYAPDPGSKHRYHHKLELLKAEPGTGL